MYNATVMLQNKYGSTAICNAHPKKKENKKFRNHPEVVEVTYHYDYGIKIFLLHHNHAGLNELASESVLIHSSNI